MNSLKEHIYKRLFVYQDKLKAILSIVARLCNAVLFLGAMLFIALLIIRMGFLGYNIVPANFYRMARSLFIAIFFAKYAHEFIRFKTKKFKVLVVEAVFFLFNLVVMFANLPASSERPIAETALTSHFILALALSLIFLSEAYKLIRVFNSIKIAPPLLFAISFLLLIFVGSGLLMLPNAHVQPISYLDALFTSASAVCVTGLVVVDTATAYTQIGHLIIMGLIQIGGLGIMAFTGFFAYAFTGTFSFKDRMLLKDVFSAETLNDIFRMLLKIILLTFLTELIGAAVIFLTVKGTVVDPVMFSVFHSVSAFCNAGFSTVEGGLAAGQLAGNNALFLTIAVLIILGGIGFPVLMGLYSILKYRMLRIFRLQGNQINPAGLIGKSISNKLVITTTLFLIFAGTVAYYFLERHGSLANTGGTQRWLVSFFGSVTARTAGFNIVDMTQWCYATLFVMVVLMWIGASPGSTGGGIKTTTAALAALASYNFIRGRHHIEISYRKIGGETISRVLVVIVLSVVVVIFGFFMLLLTEPSKDPMQLLFETVSAFATVGLSIADTSTLSVPGKEVIILLMYIGRVGPLTLLSGIFVSHRRQYYRYPEYDLSIN
jgi:trk system potassium uptake protein